MQLAEMALMGGHVSDAENILLQAGLYFRAIMLNIKTYQWDRALQLATKYKTHIDTVLASKMRHIQRFGKKETSKLFLQYEKQVMNVARTKLHICSKANLTFQIDNIFLFSDPCRLG